MLHPVGRRSTGVILISLLLPVFGFAQDPRGTVLGRVADGSGAVVPNATIVAKHLDTGGESTGVSSETGNYSLQQLRVGAYEITVTQPGFKTFKREGLSLSAAQALRLPRACRSRPVHRNPAVPPRRSPRAVQCPVQNAMVV